MKETLDIYLSPIVKTRKKLKLSKDMNNKIGDDVIYFYNTLKNKMQKPDFNYFLNNISTAKLSCNGEKGKKYDNCYLISENKIIVQDKNYKEALFHEMLHLASSIYSQGYYYTGFAQSDGSNRYYSYKFTEGYTQLLDDRYFCKEPVSCYVFPKEIAKNTEKIIGQADMENMYMRASLIDFFTNFSNYLELNELFGLLVNVEYIENKLYLKNDTKTVKNIEIKGNQIKQRLIKAMYNKIKLEDRNINEINDYINNFISYFATANNWYYLMNNKDSNEYLKYLYSKEKTKVYMF